MPFLTAASTTSHASLRGGTPHLDVADFAPRYADSPGNKLVFGLFGAVHDSRPDLLNLKHRYMTAPREGGVERVGKNVDRARRPIHNRVVGTEKIRKN